MRILAAVEQPEVSGPRPPFIGDTAYAPATSTGELSFPDEAGGTHCHRVVNLPDSRGPSVLDGEVLRHAHRADPVDVHVMEVHRLIPVRELAQQLHALDQLAKPSERLGERLRPLSLSATLIQMGLLPYRARAERDRLRTSMNVGPREGLRAAYFDRGCETSSHPSSVQESGGLSDTIEEDSPAAPAMPSTPNADATAAAADIGHFTGSERFALIRPIGQGGMGVVYEAFDRERNCHVALKTLRRLGPEALVRFKNEFRALQDLHHANLVRLDQLVHENGHWFFTMELVDGVDFLRWVRPLDLQHDFGPTEADRTEPTTNVVALPGVSAPPGAATPPPSSRFDEGRLRAALIEMARGLCALHAAGKVHRDIKPSNLLVTPHGRVVILDFGLVSDVFDATERGTILGTLSFMAPEQAASEPVGTDADWYAAGVVLYLALTGRTPFTGTPPQVLYSKLHEDPVPPSRIAEGIPADLDQLCRDLLLRRACDRPRGAEVLRRLGVDEPSVRELSSRAFFVGRRSELRQLAGSWSRSSHGRATAVLVAGESGVGKSALIRRFIDQLDRAETLVLSGRCYEREASPFKAVDEVVDQLSRYLGALPKEEVEPLLPERIGLAAGVFPALQRVSGIAERVGRQAPELALPFQIRLDMFAALRELLLRIRRRRPIVIAIDDLQWAEADSLALLAFLLAPPQAPPLLLCASVRSVEELPPGLRTLRRQLGQDMFTLLVDRLPHDDASELAQHLLTITEGVGSSQTAEAVASTAGGHPMFIEALVQHRSTSVGVSQALRLEDALIARMNGLPPGSALILGFVCVAGMPIEQEVCARAAGLPLGQLAHRVDALRAARLVRTSGVGPRDTVEPYHDRVRESVTAHLPTEARRDVHARLARALEEGGRTDPESLVFHFRASGYAERAARYAVRAAEQASKMLAFAQAARLYRIALELNDASGPEARMLKVRLAEALANGGHGGAASEVYLALADDGDDAERGTFLRLAAEQLLMSGRMEEGLAASRAVLESVGLAMPATPRRALVSLLATRTRLAVRGSALRYRLRDPREIAPETLARIDACWSVGVGLAIVDHIRAADLQARHILLSVQSGDAYRIACALAGEASFVATGGGPKRARAERVLAEAETLATKLGHPNAIGYVAFAHGSMDYLVGRWRESREHCDRAETIFHDRCAGAAWWIQTARYFALESLWYSGEIDELCRRVPALRANAEARGDLYAVANLGIGIPNATALVADDVAGAREHISRAMAGWTRQSFHVQHLGQTFAELQADLYAGDGASAWRRITSAWRSIRGSLILRVQLTRIITHQQRGRAALAAAAALPPRAAARRALISQAQRDAAAMAKEGMPWSDPLAALLRAGVHRLAGDPARALREVAAAAHGFDAAGMALYRAAAQLRYGDLLGGDEGAALAGAAEAWMSAARIRRPRRMAALLAPGFNSTE